MVLREGTGTVRGHLWCFPGLTTTQHKSYGSNLRVACKINEKIILHVQAA